MTSQPRPPGFFFLNETWLEDSCSATVLNETAPPNFTFMRVCRTVRRGGGVAALFKDVYQCKQAWVTLGGGQLPPKQTIQRSGKLSNMFLQR